MRLEKINHWVRNLFIGLSLIVMTTGAVTACQRSTTTPHQETQPPLGETPPPLEGTLSIERRIEPPSLIPGQEVCVQLSLRGEQADDCHGIPARPVDMFLVFDISISAEDGWEHTVQLTDQLIDYLSRSVYTNPTAPPAFSQMGLISSHRHGAELLQGLTNDYDQLHAGISALKPAGDTKIAFGIRMAIQELTEAGNDHAKAIVLMLHDDTVFKNSAREAIEEAKAKSISVYLVANSQGIDEEDQITIDVAADYVPQERVYLDPTAEDLYELFINATDGWTDLAAAGVHVVESFTPAGALEVFDVEGPNGHAEAGQVVWDIPQVPVGESVELSYCFRTNGSAGDTISFADNLAWLDCNGYPHGTTPELIATVEAAIPTNTPQVVVIGTPGASTPTSSSPVSITVPSGPTGTPTPIPTGGLYRQLRIAFIGLPGWLRWILLALPILALLAFLWWWLRRDRSAPPSPRLPSRPPKRQVEEKTGPGIKKEPPKLPPRHDVITEWRPKEVVKDARGQELTLWIRPQANTVEEKLSSEPKVKLVIRVDEGEHKVGIGRAEMVIRWEEKSDLLTREAPPGRQVRLAELEVSKKARLRGIEKILLQRIESLARQHKAQEIIYAKSPSDELRELLQQAGYRPDDDSGVWHKTLPQSNSSEHRTRQDEKGGG